MSERSPADDAALQETRPSPSEVEPPGSSAAARMRTRHWLDIIEAVLMGVVAIATAWGGYQAARWSGLQSMRYNEASAIRVEATRASTRAGQLSLYDTVMFNQWLNAYSTGQNELAAMYERRFRPEFRPAFQAWLATDPFHDPKAPPGPLFMPEYKVADADRASQLEAQAAGEFNAGKVANQQSDAYVLNAVFLASTLFFIAIGQRFEWNAVRIAILAIAFAMLCYGLYHLAIYPVL